VLRCRRAVMPTLHSLLATRYSLLATRYSLLATRYSLLATRYSLLATRYSLLATHFVLDDAEHVARIGKYLQHGQLLLVVSQLELLLVHDDRVRQVAHLAAGGEEAAGR